VAREIGRARRATIGATKWLNPTASARGDAAVPSSLAGTRRTLRSWLTRSSVALAALGTIAQRRGCRHYCAGEARCAAMQAKSAL